MLYFISFALRRWREDMFYLYINKHFELDVLLSYRESLYIVIGFIRLISELMQIYKLPFI